MSRRAEAFGQISKGDGSINRSADPDRRALRLRATVLFAGQPTRNRLSPYAKRPLDAQRTRRLQAHVGPPTHSGPEANKILSESGFRLIAASSCTPTPPSAGPQTVGRCLSAMAARRVLQRRLDVVDLGAVPALLRGHHALIGVVRNHGRTLRRRHERIPAVDLLHVQRAVGILPRDSNRDVFGHRSPFPFLIERTHLSRCPRRLFSAIRCAPY